MVRERVCVLQLVKEKRDGQRIEKELQLVPRWFLGNQDRVSGVSSCCKSESTKCSTTMLEPHPNTHLVFRIFFFSHFSSYCTLSGYVSGGVGPGYFSHCRIGLLVKRILDNFPFTQKELMYRLYPRRMMFLL